MVIYGTRSIAVKSQRLTNEACIACQKTDTTTMYIFSKYAHIFWIPVFPLGTTGASSCESCQGSLDRLNMPKHFKKHYQEVKEGVTIPAWQYTGLFLASLGLLAWVFLK